MLAMLKGVGARGLPDAIIDRVALQGAADGHALDDVIVHGHLPNGAPATLEVQVKRDISFSPKDKIFKDVVEQIADVIKKPAFATEFYEMAVATGKVTGVIGSYQELLSRARVHTSEISFFKHLNQEKVYSDDMRAFAATLRGHLHTFGADASDETIWQVLRRFHILHFDFIAPGSRDELSARNSCMEVLHPDAKERAADFWDALVLRAEELAANGGEATTASLTDHFKARIRFEGDNRFHLVRAAVAETAVLALKDVSTTVLGVSLPRGTYIDAIRAAIATQSRFIEIRGDAGVGKSGLLKHFALEVARESRVLVLAPGRVTPGGWGAMKAQLNFSGSADAFLRDLASDGGGWLFIDNLDFYADGERQTINDLLLTAANVPGFIVVATARARFGLDQKSWLDADALTALGKAKPVILAPIADDELEELREAEPRLFALLAPDHPANAVTRNLYLLSRLLTLPEGETLPRTEIALARLWWKNGGGDPGDATARVRSRVLRDLGERAIRGDITFNVTSLDAAALDALVKAEVLSDFGNDRVAFRHDVLREWAIANVLAGDATKLTVVPLATMGSPVQLRGVELAARVALEESKDPAVWRTLYDAVSATGSHPIWRRAALLALIHSEAVKATIALMSDALLADDAALLREIVPIMTAVDMIPVQDIPWPGIDAKLLPSGFNIPSGPAWIHLVAWALGKSAALPPKALPEVVELYVNWCGLGLLTPGDPLTPLVIKQFGLWLAQIETADDWEDFRARRARQPVFGGVIDGVHLERMESDMRNYLALLAARAPDVAKEYLAHVQTLKRKDDIYRKLLQVRGTLAQAAPAEIAAITMEYLRKPEHDDEDEGLGLGRRIDGALAHTDEDFLEASPAQGPFYDLLKHAPAVGLKLVRDLVDSVIAYHVEDKEPEDDDVIVLEMPGGARRFPWTNTYLWSDHSYYYSVTSALMALEAWAHERIDNGDDIAIVIGDVLGDGKPPAAYVLVAVHLILSHWPDSASAGVPFVGSPELLSLDLDRTIRAGASNVDFLGLRGLHKEPATGPRLASLRERISRRATLDELFGNYALLDAASTERLQLRTLLAAAQTRLGAHRPEDDRSDPRLMVFLALNATDPANWVSETKDGVAGYRYRAPRAEIDHFKPAQARLIESNNDLRLTAGISRLIDDTSQASTKNAEAAAKWAEAKTAATNGEIEEAIEQAVLGAAMIAMRDGTPELRASKRAWAETQFTRVSDRKPDVAGRMRDGMLFNPAAIAFAGRMFALQDVTPQRDDFERLLRMVVADAAAARGAAPAATVIDAIDARLRPAMLRVAFTAAVYFWHPWDLGDERIKEVEASRQQGIEQALAAELNWLTGKGAEPAWPTFVDDEIRGRGRRRGIRIGVPPEPPPPDPKTSRRFVNHQEAALWLSALSSRSEANKSWMEAIETLYASWTFAANGAGLAEGQDVDEPSEWNAAYFGVMTANFRGRSIDAILAALEPLFKLQDDSFFDLTEVVLFKIDLLYFEQEAITVETAVAIRQRFAARLAQSYSFQRQRKDKSSGIEVHLGPAIATTFFNNRGFRGPPTLYLPAGFIQRSLPFVPILQSLAEQAPGLFVALCGMNWVEAEPTNEHVPFVVGFATSAIGARPDDKVFWLDHGIAARVCGWLTDRVDADPATFATTSSYRPPIDTLLAKLVAMGSTDARRLEVRLQSVR